ncbi:MAG: CoB--CoM heterodisulfide reductase iron-sulfur subunit A family protein [archaeon]|nr:CoB--CoM heterodisulfide reductase iron-sulfur subunit A family protein [archaeon]
MEEKIGVYVCQCGKNIADVIDVDKLVQYAKALPNVSESKTYKFMCSKNGQNLIADDIKSGKISRAVVAACSPLMHEETFRRVLNENGVNEFYFEQANIREHASWVNMADHDGALEIGKDHVKMACSKVIHNKPLTRQEMPVIKKALVVGAGISGMYAALDLADKYEVFLVERSPTIGGHMAQLDKTFPTMDCSACITTPKMVEVGRHPNINLMTYSEIEDVDLTTGNFKVKIRKKSRRINHNICTGCGACAEACTVVTGNEFDMNLGFRTAAYIPFPQAVPSQYTIDAESCIECGACEEACEIGAIELDQKDEIIEINVGSIIIATGNDIFDPSKLSRFGYNKYKDVITGIEMERILSSSGPTLGKVIRPSTKQPPLKIAWLQCVGSRDFHENTHKYCSRVCCMYAIKQARQYKEKHPEAEIYIFYMDIRAFGKGYEEFYEIASREYGINFVRGRIGEVIRMNNGKLLIRGSDTLLAENFETEIELLVLSSGLESRSDSDDIGRLFGVQNTEDGMFMEAHPKLKPVESLSDGIFIAGTCQAPRDIPDSVTQAKAAASSADNFMVSGTVAIEPYNSYIIPSKCSGCKSCLSICPYEAITYDEYEKISEISIVKCKGCGACMATCPSKAIVQNHFTQEQINKEIESLIPWLGEKEVI